LGDQLNSVLCESIISRLSLSESDKNKLIKKRGFSEDIIDKLKFVSCGPHIIKDDFFRNEIPAEFLNALKNENIVIPYFDPDGKIIHIRPHKFGIADESVSIYAPYSIMGADFSRIVLAESEFKAVASCIYGVPAIGVPGIWSFTKKNSTRLVEFLKILAPKKIVI
jgi:hypothetical protein